MIMNQVFSFLLLISEIKGVPGEMILPQCQL